MIDVYSLILLLSRTAVGFLFILSGVSKLISRGSFQRTVIALSFLPKWSRKPIQSLPWFELTIGALLVMGAFTRYAALIAVALLVLFSLVAFLAVQKGLDVPCSCFGDVSKSPLSMQTVVRNFVIVLLALPTLVSGHASIWSIDGLFRSSAAVPLSELVLIVTSTLVIIGLAAFFSIARHALESSA